MKKIAKVKLTSEEKVTAKNKGVSPAQRKMEKENQRQRDALIESIDNCSEQFSVQLLKKAGTVLLEEIHDKLIKFSDLQNDIDAMQDERYDIEEELDEIASVLESKN